MTVLDRPRIVVGVPIDSDGRGLGTADPPSGTELAPNVLRDLGLLEEIRAEDAGDLPVRIVGGRDPANGIVGYPTLLETWRGVHEGLRPVLEDAAFPIVLGGCCAMVPAIAAALRDRHAGAVGLAYVDGHLDLYDARTSPTGEAADMPVAFCVGEGDEPLAPLGWARPLVQAEHVALLAHRDAAEALADGSALPEDVGIDLSRDAAAIQHGGPAAEGRAAAEALAERVPRFWLSLDIDVLATPAFPATPYHQDGGLSRDELVALCRPLAHHPACVGMDVKCYDPGMDDTERASGRALVRLLGAILAP